MIPSNQKKKHHVFFPNPSYIKAIAFLEQTLWKRNLFWLSPRNTSMIARATKAKKTVQFRYPRFPYDLQKIHHAIHVLQQAKGKDAFLLQSYAKRSEALLAMILAIQQKKPFPIDASKMVYGFPSTRSVHEAKKILKRPIQLHVSQAKKQTVPFSQAKLFLQEQLPKGWKLKLMAMPSLAKVSPQERILYLKKTHAYDKKFLQRLYVHEIGVHVTRAENHASLSYPYKACLRGWFIEEGLAMYWEAKQNVLEEHQQRTYAARLLAVYAHHLPLHKLLSLFLPYGFSWEEAFTLALRAKRGVLASDQPGGLTKDHLYLSGYLQLKRWVGQGNDPQLLLQGIIHWKDLPILQRWYASLKQ